MAGNICKCAFNIYLPDRSMGSRIPLLRTSVLECSGPYTPANASFPSPKHIVSLWLLPFKPTEVSKRHLFRQFRQGGFGIGVGSFPLTVGVPEGSY